MFWYCGMFTKPANVLTVTDSHSNQSLVGQAEIDFADQDDSTVVVQFSDFPLQAAR